jgi:hypothetical protein
MGLLPDSSIWPAYRPERGASSLLLKGICPIRTTWVERILEGAAHGAVGPGSTSVQMARRRESATWLARQALTTGPPPRA